MLENIGTWLNEALNELNLNEEYLDTKRVVFSRSVVNGTAERGIKDIENYANSVKSGHDHDSTVLV